MNFQRNDESFPIGYEFVINRLTRVGSMKVGDKCCTMDRIDVDINLSCNNC